MIATVDIAVGLHRCSPSTIRRHRTDTRRLPYPIGKGGVEELDEDPADVFLHPFIVDPTEETSPLFRRYRLCCYLFPHPFYDWCKLQIVTTYLFEEPIEIHWIISIHVVDCSHCIPLHTEFLQKTDAMHRLAEVLPIGVVHVLGSVNTDADEEVMLSEKSAPFLSEQCTVGL